MCGLTNPHDFADEKVLLEPAGHSRPRPSDWRAVCVRGLEPGLVSGYEWLGLWLEINEMVKRGEISAVFRDSLRSNCQQHQALTNTASVLNGGMIAWCSARAPLNKAAGGGVPTRMYKAAMNLCKNDDFTLCHNAPVRPLVIVGGCCFAIEITILRSFVSDPRLIEVTLAYLSLLTRLGPANHRRAPVKHRGSSERSRSTVPAPTWRPRKGVMNRGARYSLSSQTRSACLR